MSKLKDLEAQYEPDLKIGIHENAVRQLTQRISTHDAGLAELVKNGCDAYSEADAPSENEVVIVLLKNSEKQMPAIVGCLDFVGMTTDKIDLFAGSNVVGYVAEKLGRRWISIEIVKEYVKASRYRFTSVR